MPTQGIRFFVLFPSADSGRHFLFPAGSFYGWLRFHSLPSASAFSMA